MSGFRFHLSTAIVLMVATGGLVWANLIVSEYRKPAFPDLFEPSAIVIPPEILADPGVDVEFCYGWPAPFFISHRETQYISSRVEYAVRDAVDYKMLIGDIAVWIGILAFTWGASEAFSRRHA